MTQRISPSLQRGTNKRARSRCVSAADGDGFFSIQGLGVQ